MPQGTSVPVPLGRVPLECHAPPDGYDVLVEPGRGCHDITKLMTRLYTSVLHDVPNAANRRRMLMSSGWFIRSRVTPVRPWSG
jgi:hypothetical protein